MIFNKISILYLYSYLLSENQHHDILSHLYELKHASIIFLINFSDKKFFNGKITLDNIFKLIFKQENDLIIDCVAPSDFIKI